MTRPLPTLLLRETPTGSGQAYGLPADLLVRARARLGKFVLFQAALFGVVAVMLRSIPVELDVSRDTLYLFSAFQLIAIVVHLLLYWVIRSSHFGDVFVLNVGLLYEFALCLAMTVADQWINYIRIGSFNDMTFASLIIVVYPLIVPSPPLRTLVSALAAGATIPGGIVILEALGMTPDAHQYLISSMVAGITVAVAMFASAVVHGMHRAVAEARQLGSYRLVERLGQGGMGEVWRAQHKLLARPAAIKLVKPEVIGGRSPGDTARVLGRFEREAQATALMRSPHTIALYDFGIDGGTFYYVMELLDGFDLESLIRQHGPIPAGRTIHLLLQVCDSLAEAHESSLIHRDVKPANLYLCRYGRRVDFVKVLDFGLVKPVGTEGDVQMTQEQEVGGTPGFMAPEQVLGNRTVDARTDLYALGCVGYWLLTGELVFGGSTAMETMMHHAKTQPTPPSQVVEFEVPRDLEAALMTCLQKDSDDRPQSADALATTLANCADAGAWTAERAAQWWVRHRPGDTVSDLTHGKQAHDD